MNKLDRDIEKAQEEYRKLMLRVRLAEDKIKSLWDKKFNRK